MRPADRTASITRFCSIYSPIGTEDGGTKQGQVLEAVFVGGPGFSGELHGASRPASHADLPKVSVLPLSVDRLFAGAGNRVAQ